MRTRLNNTPTIIFAILIVTVCNSGCVFLYTQDYNGDLAEISVQRGIFWSLAQNQKEPLHKPINFVFKPRFFEPGIYFFEMTWGYYGKTQYFLIELRANYKYIFTVNDVDDPKSSVSWYKEYQGDKK